MKNEEHKKAYQVSIMLCDLRSAHNVGSIFRTADAAGASMIYLAGTTPTPRDRFGRPQSEIAKTALGAEKTVPWEYAPDPLALVAHLKREGMTIISAEQDARAADYRTVRLAGDTVFIFGNEVAGLAQEILAASDRVVEIPLYGAKESLNVSVAAGVILFGVENSPRATRINTKRRR